MKFAPSSKPTPPAAVTGTGFKTKAARRLFQGPDSPLKDRELVIASSSAPATLAVHLLDAAAAAAWDLDNVQGFPAEVGSESKNAAFLTVCPPSGQLPRLASIYHGNAKAAALRDAGIIPPGRR